jgi:hypothetical protein
MAKTYKKYIKFYLPKLVFDHFHYKLGADEPTFRYDINIFYSILNELSEIKYPKDHESKKGYQPMYSVWLKQRYGNEYALYMQFLLNHSIIYSDNSYKEGKCTYYKINESYTYINRLESDYYKNSHIPYSFPDKGIYRLITIDNKGVQGISNLGKYMDVVEISIDTKSKVGSKIIRGFNREQDRIKKGPDHIKKMQKHYKENLKIDDERAMKYIHEQLGLNLGEANGDQELITKAQNAFHQRIRSVIEIRDGKLRFSRNGTNKRIDTNLTNMAADLRKFIVGYDQLSYLDLCNSQPVLLNILLKRHKGTNRRLDVELIQYEELTLSGQWYEQLAGMYSSDRDTAKQIWMLLAYSRTKQVPGIKRVFKNKFPEIQKIINRYKKVNYENFAVELQSIESGVFVDQIYNELVEIGILPYGMHDGLLVPKDKKEETYQIMARVLESKLGKIPVIKVDDEKRIPK